MRPLCTLMAGLLLFSCSDDDTNDGPDVKKPVITATEAQLGVSLAAEAGSWELHYSVSNATEGDVVTAECPDSWIEILPGEEAGIIPFNYEGNIEAEDRSTTIRLSYPGADDVEISIRQQGTQDWIISIAVTDPQAFNAAVSITSNKKDKTYVMLNLPKQDFDKFTTDDELTAYYVDLFRSAAAAYEVSLETLLSQILYKGNLEGNINNLKPLTDYVAVAFGLTADGTVTSKVFSDEYRTSEVPHYDEKINISPKILKPNFVELELRPESDQYRYYADIMAQEEFDKFPSLDEFAADVIAGLQEVIDMNTAFGNTMTWEDITLQGISNTSVNSLYSDTNYTSFAFGVTNGYRTTDVFSRNDKTPQPSLTSNCTFVIQAISTDPKLSKVRITPSDDSDYFAIITTKSETDATTPERFADDCIIYANTFDTWITWTGEQTLEVTDLAADTDYTVAVFGVGDYYERTTKVYYYTLHTNSLDKVDITFDLKVTSTDQSSVYYACTPSDLNQSWAVGTVKKEKHDSFASEEEFVEYLKTAGNGFAIMNMGVATGSLMYDCEWGLIEPGEYLLYAVACYSDGWTYEVLSDLTYVPYTISERTFSDATVDISLVVYDGNELAAYNPAKYSEYGGKAAISILFTPAASCVEYYTCYQARTAEAMQGLYMDMLIDNVIKGYGDLNPGNSPTSYMMALPWDAAENCIMAVGVNAQGVDGYPSVVSLKVSRDQAVPFDPESVAAARPVKRAGTYTAPSVPKRSAVRMAVPAQRPATGRRITLMPAADMQQAQSAARTQIVENHVRRQVERAGGKYYTPAERAEIGSLAEITSFEVR